MHQAIGLYAELNVKFKADITMMLTDITDWHRVEAGRGVRYAHRDIISKGRVGCI
jgi:hypothetical protein